MNSQFFIQIKMAILYFLSSVLTAAIYLRWRRYITAVIMNGIRRFYRATLC